MTLICASEELVGPQIVKLYLFITLRRHTLCLHNSPCHSVKALGKK